MSDEHVLEVAGRTLTVTNPQTVFFSERGETKLDLVRYYLAVAEPFMRIVGGRPTLMQRFPRGAEGSSGTGIHLITGHGIPELHNHPRPARPRGDDRHSRRERDPHPARRNTRTHRLEMRGDFSERRGHDSELRLRSPILRVWQRRA